LRPKKKKGAVKYRGMPKRTKWLYSKKKQKEENYISGT